MNRSKNLSQALNKDEGYDDNKKQDIKTTEDYVQDYLSSREQLSKLIKSLEYLLKTCFLVFLASVIFIFPNYLFSFISTFYLLIILSVCFFLMFGSFISLSFVYSKVCKKAMKERKEECRRNNIHRGL